MFIDALDIDDVIAHLLVTEGFSSVEEVAYVPLEDLSDIEGFDENVADELQQRARVFLEEQDARNAIRSKELGVSEELTAIESLSSTSVVKLGEAGVKTLDDLADLAGDELLEIIGKDAMTLEQANEVIMSARAHWFTGDEGEGEQA